MTRADVLTIAAASQWIPCIIIHGHDPALDQHPLVDGVVAVHDALDDDAAVTLVEMGEVELKGLPGEHVVWRVLTQ